MTSQERAELAAGYKASGKCNCCQSVVRAYADCVDADPETLMKMASGFGAGMGCAEGTCGSLCGAVMVAGLLKDGKGTPMVSRQVLAEFARRSGDTICKRLKGLETGLVLCQCNDCVRNAVLSLESVLPQD